MCGQEVGVTPFKRASREQLRRTRNDLVGASPKLAILAVLRSMRHEATIQNRQEHAADSRESGLGVVLSRRYSGRNWPCM